MSDRNLWVIVPFLLINILSMVLSISDPGLLGVVTFAAGYYISILVIYKTNKVKSVMLVLFLLAIQNTVIGLAFNFGQLSSQSINVCHYDIAIIDSGIFFFALALLVSRGTPIERFDRALLSIIPLMCFYMLFKHQTSILSQAAYFRDYSTPVLLFVFVRVALKSFDDIVSLLKGTEAIGLLVAIYGLVTWLLANASYWLNVIHVNQVFTVTGITLTGTSLPPMWYTNFLGLSWLRMASTVIDPVDLSYLLAGSCLASLILSRGRISLQVLILFVATVLTEGKGGLLLLIVGAIPIVGWKLALTRRRTLLVTSAVIGIACGVIYFHSSSSSVTIPHLQGLSFSFRNLAHNPLGNGLGSGGNFALIAGVVSGSQWLSSGGESAFAAVAYQLGIPGLVLLYGVWLLLALRSISRGYWGVVLCFGILGFLVASLFQENTFGPAAFTSTGFVLAAIGKLMALRTSEQSRSVDEMALRETVPSDNLSEGVAI